MKIKAKVYSFLIVFITSLLIIVTLLVYLWNSDRSFQNPLFEPRINANVMTSSNIDLTRNYKKNSLEMASRGRYDKNLYEGSYYEKIKNSKNISDSDKKIIKRLSYAFLSNEDNKKDESMLQQFDPIKAKKQPFKNYSELEANWTPNLKGNFQELSKLIDQSEIPKIPQWYMKRMLILLNNIMNPICYQKLPANLVLQNENPPKIDSEKGSTILKDLILWIYNLVAKFWSKAAVTNFLEEITVINPNDLQVLGIAVQKNDKRYIYINKNAINDGWSNIFQSIQNWEQRWSSTYHRFHVILHELGHIFTYYDSRVDINQIEALKSFLLKKINNIADFPMLNANIILNTFANSDYSLKVNKNGVPIYEELIAEGFSYWLVWRERDWKSKTKAWYFWNEFFMYYLPQLRKK